MTYGGTPGNAMAVVTDGTDFLTLWMDNDTPGRQGIYATIVNESGGTRPYPPPPLLAGDGWAQAVWTGDAYLVLLSHPDGVVTAVHLNRDGQAIDAPSRVDLSGFVHNLAWNGHVALAVVLEPETDRGTLALLDAAGHVVRSGIAVLTNVSWAAVTAAAAGDAFVVAWTEYIWPPEGAPLMKAQAMSISGDGTAAPPFELVPERPGYLNIASASGIDEAAIAVHDPSYGSVPADHHLWRFRIDGATASVVADPVAILEPNTSEVHVVRTPDGFAASYFFSLPDTAGVRLGRMAFGSVLRRSLPIDADGRSIAAIETNGTTTLIVCSDVAMSGVRFDASLTQRKGEIEPIAIAPPMQSRPSIAIAGDVAMVAWVEGKSVMLRRFDRSGHARDVEAITLGGNPSVYAQPKIVFTGKLWLVVWEAFRDHVMMQRISSDGAVLDEGPIEVGEGLDPAVTSNGRVAAVVMTSLQNKGIKLVRLTADGHRIDGAPLIVRDHVSAEPAVASNGEEFLVTWTEYSQAPYSIPNLPGVFGERLTASGDPIEAAPISIAQGPLLETGSSIASNGNDFVVVYYTYEHTQPFGSPPIVYTYAKRVLRNGTLVDTTPEQEGFLIGKGALPEITATGDGYIVTFSDAEDRWNTFAPHPQSIFAVSTDARGATLSQPRTVLRTSTCSNMYAVSAAGDAVWLAYSRMATDVNVQRVFTRPIAEEPAKRRSVRR